MYLPSCCSHWFPDWAGGCGWCLRVIAASHWAGPTLATTSGAPAARELLLGVLVQPRAKALEAIPFQLEAEAVPLSVLTLFSLHACALAGASLCPPGFWSAKGSMKPCQQCPPGRTTVDDPGQQANITDCLVKRGFGVVNSSATGLAAFAVNTTGMTLQAQAGLVVLECPVGYYGDGGEVGSTCTQCPCGSTTTVTGAIDAANCTGKHWP